MEENNEQQNQTNVEEIKNEPEKKVETKTASP